MKDPSLPLSLSLSLCVVFLVCSLITVVCLTSFCTLCDSLFARCSLSCCSKTFSWSGCAEVSHSESHLSSGDAPTSLPPDNVRSAIAQWTRPEKRTEREKREREGKREKRGSLSLFFRSSFGSFFGSFLCVLPFGFERRDSLRH
jgi:hypothetical protein